MLSYPHMNPCPAIQAQNRSMASSSFSSFFLIRARMHLVEFQAAAPEQ
jgi:hypothetical protein